MIIAKSVGAGSVRDDDRGSCWIRPEGVSGKQGELVRDVLGVLPSGEDGDPPKSVFQETGASGGQEFVAEDDIEPPGSGVKATGLKALSVPTKLASGGAGLSMRKVGARGDSGVMGHKGGTKH
jgi:hypothetical protein